MVRTRKDYVEPPNKAVFVSETDLARRWMHSIRTLQRWRANGQGPVAHRIGRRTLYRLADVEAFEAACQMPGEPQ